MLACLSLIAHSRQKASNLSTGNKSSGKDISANRAHQISFISGIDKLSQINRILAEHIFSCSKNSHHIVEATFKSFTRALHKALKVNDLKVLSTKGIL